LTVAQRFQVRVARQSDGSWLATCETPLCLRRARSEAEALEGLRAEIRYRIEWCPCSAVDDEWVELDVARGPR
jgi:hypothetical protein